MNNSLAQSSPFRERSRKQYKRPFSYSLLWSILIVFPFSGYAGNPSTVFGPSIRELHHLRQADTRVASYLNFQEFKNGGEIQSEGRAKVILSSPDELQELINHRFELPVYGLEINAHFARGYLETIDVSEFQNNWGHLRNFTLNFEGSSYSGLEALNVAKEESEQSSRELAAMENVEPYSWSWSEYQLALQRGNPIHYGKLTLRLRDILEIEEFLASRPLQRVQTIQLNIRGAVNDLTEFYAFLDGAEKSFWKDVRFQLMGI